MAYFLLKSEPAIYSFEQFVKDTERDWVGITNHIALQHLRSMQEGEKCIFYHAVQQNKAVGTCIVTSIDKTNPLSPVIHVKVGPALERQKTLYDILDEPMFDESPLVTMGRVPVVPLTVQQWEWFFE